MSKGFSNKYAPVSVACTVAVSGDMWGPVDEKSQFSHDVEEMLEKDLGIRFHELVEKFGININVGEQSDYAWDGEEYRHLSFLPILVKLLEKIDELEGRLGEGARYATGTQPSPKGISRDTEEAIQDAKHGSGDRTSPISPSGTEEPVLKRRRKNAPDRKEQKVPGTFAGFLEKQSKRWPIFR